MADIKESKTLLEVKINTGIEGIEPGVITLKKGIHEDQEISYAIIFNGDVSRSFGANNDREAVLGGMALIYDVIVEESSPQKKKKHLHLVEKSKKEKK
jgi:hypothetical protein